VRWAAAPQKKKTPRHNGCDEEQKYVINEKCKLKLRVHHSPKHEQTFAPVLWRTLSTV